MSKISIPTSNEQADLIFKVVGERELMLTFLPPTKKRYKKAPVYFLITGGGWHSGSRASMINFSQPSVTILREYGYAVVSVDYRTIAEEGINMMDIVTDCFDGLRYVCHYADVLGIDKYNITTSGHSAGGHLCLLVAYANPDDFKCETSLEADYKIKATVPLSPITVMYDNGEYPKTHNLGSLSDRYIGCDDIKTRKLTSPICYASKECPPTLLCAGNADNLVLCNSSEFMYEALKEKGVLAKIVISHHGGHCFEKIGDVLNSYPNGEEMQDYIVDFVLHHTAP